MNVAKMAQFSNAPTTDRDKNIYTNNFVIFIAKRAIVLGMLPWGFVDSFGMEKKYLVSLARSITIVMPSKPSFLTSHKLGSLV